MKTNRTTMRMREKQATTRTNYHVNRPVNEPDYDERKTDDYETDDKNDDEGSSKDEFESVERQRKSESLSVRSEDDEESRDSFEPPSTSSSSLRVSLTAGRGGWSDTSSHASRSTNSASSSSPLNTPFVLDSSKGSHPRSYQLRVAQHPVTGATCGSLSRIPLAPPLFVQLTVTDGSGNVIPADDDLPFLVAIISLHRADANDPEDSSFNYQLNGTTVACPTDLRDMHGDRGIYFIFPDVGIRSSGRWRLHVSLMRIALIGAQSILVKGDVGRRIAGIWTEPFDIGPQQVYVAPKITALTKHFIRQGVQMFISSSVIPG